MLKKLNVILGLVALFLFVSCDDKKDDEIVVVQNEIFNTWKLVNPNANVELLVRPDYTFHVDVLLNEEIEVEGRIELDQNKISFINIQGSDPMSSDPRPGVYYYEIKSDTIRFTLINDPLERRAGFLASPWVKNVD
ncbi:hypothetical protein ACFSQP_05050 [Bizionia sediminis]|uniref:Uncharacterized protein n=1 Tax=Bizionia sediminis TaxID=1737064 RepID=A0ABW5KRB8_9FLAO